MTKRPAYTEAPYYQSGDLCHYPGDGDRWIDHPDGDQRTDGRTGKVNIGPVWKPIVPIVATLEYDGYSRGRSAAYFWWKDIDTQVLYPMFMTDLDEILTDGLIDGKCITGTFTIIKRGQNYGIKWNGATT